MPFGLYLTIRAEGGEGGEDEGEAAYAEDGYEVRESL